jgi:hypothetical protein
LLRTGQKQIELTIPVKLMKLVAVADVDAIEENLGHGSAPVRARRHFLPGLRVGIDRDFVKREVLLPQ